MVELIFQEGCVMFVEGRADISGGVFMFVEGGQQFVEGRADISVG